MGVRVDLGWGHAEYDGRDMVTVGDRRMPRRINVRFYGSGGQPALDMVIEVVDGVPMCVSLALTRSEGGHEIRTKDLRLIRIEDWVTHIVAACSEEYTVVGNTIRSTLSIGPSTADIRNVEKARKRRPARKINREFLSKVADIYRDHFADRPVQAIEKAYGVSPRTAAWYVELCRSDEYQLLPKTERGKKKA
jgi:hypothetical protein